MRNKKEILLSGYFGFGNLGDEAILSAMISVLKDTDDVYPVVLSHNPQQTASIHRVKAINRWNYPLIWKRLGFSRALISSGGLFQDITSNRSLWYYLSVLYLAKLHRVPSLIVGCGVGPLENRINIRLARSLIKRSSFISVRDKESVQLLGSWDIDKTRINLVADFALALNYNNSKHHQHGLLGGERVNQMAISIREPMSNRKQLIEKLTEIIRICESQFNLQPVFIPTHPQMDRSITSEIIRRLDKDYQLIDLTGMEPSRVLDIFSKMHLLIGMRLHAIEFAAMVGTPFVALSYDPKVSQFTMRLGNKFRSIEINKLETHLIVNEVERINTHYDHYRRQMLERVKELEYNAHNSLKIVSDEISKLNC